MSDSRAIPDEERPFVPDETVPAEESDNPEAEASRHDIPGEGTVDEEDYAADDRDVP